MKNKKLVATVASLCLVVVAVVAAVVGVFAAVTQNVTATVSVTYTAVDVNADVTLRSMGPKLQGTAGSAATGRQLTGLLANTLSDNSKPSVVHFNAIRTTTEKALFADAYDYGWSDLNGAGASANFLGYSLYEFKFENLSNSASMQVSLSGTLNENLYAKVYYVATTPLDNSASISVTATWGAEDTTATEGALNTTSFALSGAGDVKVASASNAIASTTCGTIDANGIGYVYILVAVNNASTSLSNASATFSFVMTNPAYSVPNVPSAS